jgi:hypothetical protein
MPTEIDDVHAEGMQIDEIRCRLAILRESETSSHYKCCDYVAYASRRGRRIEPNVKLWREWYIQWMYKVANHFRFGRDVVAYAAAYIDRFATKDNSVLYSKDDLTILAMTALYIAVKVYSTLDSASALCASNLVLLTDGNFVEEDILRMERRMLATFQWKLYPPTAVCFLREYMQLLPFELSETKHQLLFDLSKYLVEICIISYDYVTYPSSVKAYAALVLALDYLPETHDVKLQMQMHEPFSYLNGLVSAWYPGIFDELRQSLSDRPPDLLLKIAGNEKARLSRSTSETGVVSQDLFKSPREVIPWWDTVLF